MGADCLGYSLELSQRVTSNEHPQYRLKDLMKDLKCKNVTIYKIRRVFDHKVFWFSFENVI